MVEKQNVHPHYDFALWALFYCGRKMELSDKVILANVELFAAGVVDHQRFMTKDHRKANRCYGMSMRALRSLFEAGEKGISALEGLLEDDRSVVRTAAATYLIQTRTDKARKALEWEAKRGTLSSPLAMVTLKRWEKGIYFDPIAGRLKGDT